MLRREELLNVLASENHLNPLCLYLSTFTSNKKIGKHHTILRCNGFKTSLNHWGRLSTVNIWIYRVISKKTKRDVGRLLSTGSKTSMELSSPTNSSSQFKPENHQCFPRWWRGLCELYHIVYAYIHIHVHMYVYIYIHLCDYIYHLAI